MQAEHRMAEIAREAGRKQGPGSRQGGLPPLEKARCREERDAP